MNCERARELFSDYLEGDADLALRGEVRNHIENCAACRREYSLFRQMWCGLSTMPDVPVPGNLRHDAIMRMARMQHETRRVAKPLFPWFNWENLLRRPVPLRSIAVAFAAILLTVVLLNVPESAYDLVTARLTPGVPAVISDGAAGDSSMVMGLGLKDVWQGRILQRRTVWVTIDPDNSSDGVTVYQVMLAINHKALMEGDTTARIGAQVYLLPPNQYGAEALASAQKVWDGNILNNATVLVPVIVDRSQGRVGTVNLMVTWRFRGRDFAYTVFLPTHGQSASRGVFDFQTSGMEYNGGSSDNLYSILQSISRKHGMPIIANAYIDQKPTAIDMGEGSLDQALRNTLYPIDAEWMYADGSVYVDKKYVPPPQ